MAEDGTRKLAVPPVTVPMKMAFGLGSTAEAIVYTTTSSFLLIYYNQVLGLPSEKVGLALSLGLIVVDQQETARGGVDDGLGSAAETKRHFHRNRNRRDGKLTCAVFSHGSRPEDAPYAAAEIAVRRKD